MIQTTLVVGLNAYEREKAIEEKMVMMVKAQTKVLKWGILLEGMCEGKVVLSEKENVLIFRVASGCICCSNKLIMRIYLNRLIQQFPDHLFLSISNPSHLEQIKQFLTTPEYEKRIELMPDMNLHATMSQ